MTIKNRLLSSAVWIMMLPILVQAAETRIVRGPSSMPVALYAEADGSKKLGDVPVGAFAAKLPLAVVNESNGYLLVVFDSRPVWIDTEQVRVSRPTKVECASVPNSLAGAPVADAGASRGAGIKYNPCAGLK